MDQFPSAASSVRNRLEATWKQLARLGFLGRYTFRIDGDPGTIPESALIGCEGLHFHLHSTYHSQAVPDLPVPPEVVGLTAGLEY